MLETRRRRRPAEVLPLGQELGYATGARPQPYVLPAPDMSARPSLSTATQ